MKRILILLLIITGFYMIYNQASQFAWFSSSEGKNAQATMRKDIDMIEVNSSSVSTTIIPEDRKDVKAVYNGKEKLSVLETEIQSWYSSNRRVLIGSIGPPSQKRKN